MNQVQKTEGDDQSCSGILFLLNILQGMFYMQKLV